MKKITLKTIYKADKTSIRTNARKHSICIKAGTTISFTDHRKAEAFLVQTNDFLNFKLFELNELYIELNTQYRRNWFYFEFNIQDERSCFGSFMQTEKYMNLMVDRGHYENGPYMVFSWMDASFCSMMAVIELLQDLHKKRNNWAEIKVLEAIRTRAEFMLSQIRDYK